MNIKYKNTKVDQEICIIRGQNGILLGRPALRELKIISKKDIIEVKVKDTNYASMLQEFDDVFNGLGKFWRVIITLNLKQIIKHIPLTRQED